MIRTFRVLLNISFLLNGFFSFGVADAQPVRPVSISYDKLVLCFPELADEGLSFKVDLDHLKEVIDEKFVSTDMQMRQRRVKFEDMSGQSMILNIQNTFVGKRKIKSELSLQKINEKGELKEQPLTMAQRMNQNLNFVDELLMSGKVRSDETSYVDTKPRGMISRYQKNFKQVQEISLADKIKERSISCEKRADLGIICTCSKK